MAKNRIDMGDFLWNIKNRGLISVLCPDKNMELAAFLKRSYCRIRDGCEEWEGVRFNRYIWVPIVRGPFNLMDFCRRLLIGSEFYNGDLTRLIYNDRERWQSSSGQINRVERSSRGGVNR